MASGIALGADAIVLATHGRTGLAHLLYGSVAEAMLARSGVPVLMVHARPGEAAPPAFDPIAARLLVPLDGSTFAEAAIPPALELLGAAGELVLCSVVARPEHVFRDDTGRVIAYLDQQEETRIAEAQRYLTGVADGVRQQHAGMHIGTDVRVGDAGTGIVAAAGERGADLVVMASHGRTGLARAVIGSVAGEVLRTGTTPVLLVRLHLPTGAAAPAAADAQFVPM